MRRPPVEFSVRLLQNKESLFDDTLHQAKCDIRHPVGRCAASGDISWPVALLRDYQTACDAMMMLMMMKSGEEVAITSTVRPGAKLPRVLESSSNYLVDRLGMVPRDGS